MDSMKKIEEILTRSIFEVFEKMFFVFAEPVQGGSGNYDVKVGITFIGPVSGDMEILISAGIAKSMVENMLNLSGSEISEPITEDCVKEAINIVCGNFLRNLEPEKKFHLSIPTYEVISYSDQGNKQAENGRIRLTFAAENGNLEVSLATSDCA
jgi:CheY-specific phosphatase CheX